MPRLKSALMEKKNLLKIANALGVQAGRKPYPKSIRKDILLEQIHEMLSIEMDDMPDGFDMTEVEGAVDDVFGNGTGSSEEPRRLRFSRVVQQQQQEMDDVQASSHHRLDASGMLASIARGGAGGGGVGGASRAAAYDDVETDVEAPVVDRRSSAASSVTATSDRRGSEAHEVREARSRSSRSGISVQGNARGNARRREHPQEEHETAAAPLPATRTKANGPSQSHHRGQRHQEPARAEPRPAVRREQDHHARSSRDRRHRSDDDADQELEVSDERHGEPRQASSRRGRDAREERELSADDEAAIEYAGRQPSGGGGGRRSNVRRDGRDGRDVRDVRDGGSPAAHRSSRYDEMESDHHEQQRPRAARHSHEPSAAADHPPPMPSADLGSFDRYLDSLLPSSGS